MVRGPPSTTLTVTLFPSTTLFRFRGGVGEAEQRQQQRVLARHLQGVGHEPAHRGQLQSRGAAGEDHGAVAKAPDQHHVERAAEGHQQGETRSEEHTSELQSLMRTSYAVFCLKKNSRQISQTSTQISDTNSYNIRLTKQANYE